MDHPAFRPAPTTNASVDVCLVGSPHEPVMRFFVWEDVLDELWFAAEYEPDRRCMCVLTGLYGLADDGPFIEVTGFEGLEYPEAMLDAIAPTMAQIEELVGDRPTLIDAHRPSAVGFFVHEPGSDALLDDHAIVLHLTLFNVPYQIALVADARAGKIAMYARQPRQKFFNACFHKISRKERSEEE